MGIDNATHLSSWRPVAVVISFLLSLVLYGVKVVSIIIDSIQSDFMRRCNYLVENVTTSFGLFSFNKYAFYGITSTSQAIEQIPNLRKIKPKLFGIP